MERAWGGWCCKHEELKYEEVGWEQYLVPKVLLCVGLAWSRSRAVKLVSTLSKWKHLREQSAGQTVWPPEVAQRYSSLVQLMWQLSVLGGPDTTPLASWAVRGTEVMCLLKDLPFACCIFMYLFQGRAASFKLPGKIKLYDSFNMTRGWQTGFLAQWYTAKRNSEHVLVPSQGGAYWLKSCVMH